MPVPSARLELPLLDAQVARELGIVATHLLEEALGVFAPDERLDGNLPAGGPGWSGGR